MIFFCSFCAVFLRALQDLEVMRELQETLKDRSSGFVKRGKGLTHAQDFDKESIFIQKLKALFGKMFPQHVVLHPTMRRM